MIRVISLGAGVQSSAMLLMGLEGRFGPHPDLAIFADTGWEPRSVYEWLERLEREVAPFPIERVSNGNIRDIGSPAAIQSGRRYIALPFFQSGGGMGRRQCSSEFKIVPILRRLRELGATAKNPAESWIGISTDEIIRIRPSRVKYAINRYPLIEAGLSREDCEAYLKGRVGEYAPKSSCIGCPFHGDDYWARLRAESPDEFEDACAFDEEIRSHPHLRSENYLHRSCRPLRSIDEFKHERQGRMFLDGFGNDCEGVCGT